MSEKVKLRCPRCGMEIEVRPLTPCDKFKNIFCGNCGKTVKDRVELEVIKDE